MTASYCCRLCVLYASVSRWFLMFPASEFIHTLTDRAYKESSMK
jgi:hypothetical protein